MTMFNDKIVIIMMMIVIRGNSRNDTGIRSVLELVL